MANTFIDAEKVVDWGLRVLDRDILLPSLIWRDGGADFVGAADDTVSVRVEAYASARTRTLRAGTPLTMDELSETKVDVTLDTDVYKGVNVSDEEMALDIINFSNQVTRPILRAIGRGVEDEIADLITGATYAHEVTLDTSAPYSSLLEARKKLNDSNVPNTERFLLVGSTIEQYILESLKDVSVSGSPAALRNADAGGVAGFRVVQHNSIPPDEAYAFHRTAYVVVSRAPRVPDGASWGESLNYEGLALRMIKDYDPLYVRDRVIGNVYIGCNVVTDNGELNDDGQFVPYETADEIGSGTPILVRAVKLTAGS